MVYNCLNKLQFWLFPPTCLLCEAPGMEEQDLCPGCYRDLTHNTTACRSCAAPLPVEPVNPLVCGQCQQNQPSFDTAYAAFRYASPVDTLIQDLKFRGRLPAARLLADLLRNYLQRHCETLPEAIIPVPLHSSRLRERGFNQSLELARPIARSLNLPLLAGHVKRTRRTPPQAQLDFTARLTNVHNAFAVTRSIPARHVAILDDVVTTGSTVSELTRVLREAGIKRVDVWACARTTRSNR